MPNSSARFSFITPSAAAGSEVSVVFTAKFPPSGGSKLNGTAISFSGSYSAGSTIRAAWPARRRSRTAARSSRMYFVARLVFQSHVSSANGKLFKEYQ